MTTHSMGLAARGLGITLVCGVPDSLIQTAIRDLEEQFSPENFVVAANEGAAIGLAVGHYVSTGTPALVFMQNSGLGNALNPLASLADSLVYAIPMVLVIGWRAEILPDGTQRADEPQHRRQGSVTLNQLSLLEIPTFVLNHPGETAFVMRQAFHAAVTQERPAAIVVRAGDKSQSESGIESNEAALPTREAMIREVANFTAAVPGSQAVPIVATTGTASRELLEMRVKWDIGSGDQDFLTVGGMGHAISIATSLARNLAPTRVLCLDGDGAMLMHAGALLQSAQQPNLIHVVLDNGTHDSVGGQSTYTDRLAWSHLAKGFGYAHYLEAKTPQSLYIAMTDTDGLSGSVLIRAVCRPGHRNGLMRPDQEPVSNKSQFMEFVTSLKDNG